MINDPNMINKLLADFNEVPKEIIKEAIKEVIEEDKKKETLQTVLQEALQITNVGRYNVKKNCYYFNKANEYVHKNNSTSSNWIKTILRRNKEKKELEVA